LVFLLLYVIYCLLSTCSISTNLIDPTSIKVQGLKSLISAQLSESTACWTMDQCATPTYTPTFQPDNFAAYFAMLGQNYLLAKMLLASPLCRYSSLFPSNMLLIYYEAFMREKCLVHGIIHLPRPHTQLATWGRGKDRGKHTARDRGSLFFFCALSLNKCT